MYSLSYYQRYDCERPPQDRGQDRLPRLKVIVIVIVIVIVMILIIIIIITEEVVIVVIVVVAVTVNVIVIAIVVGAIAQSLRAASGSRYYGY